MIIQQDPQDFNTQEQERREWIGDDWLDEQQDRARVVIVSPEMAEDIQRFYCCAGCWGHLNTYHAEKRMTRVVCDNCGDGRGFVTKGFADRRRSESAGEASDVKQMLQSAGVVQYTKRSAEEILKELGF